MIGYVSVNVAADRLGLKRRTVHDLLAAGDLEGQPKTHARKRTHWLISEASIERYIVKRRALYAAGKTRRTRGDRTEGAQGV